jgi:hypothetical protein
MLQTYENGGHCFDVFYYESLFLINWRLQLQGAGREVVAHLVQASELVANLTKWRKRRDFFKWVNEFLLCKWVSLLF